MSDQNKRNATKSFLHHDSYSSLWRRDNNNSSNSSSQDEDDAGSARLSSVSHRQREDSDGIRSDESSDNNQEESDQLPAPGTQHHLWSKPFIFPLTKHNNEQSLFFMFTLS